MDRRLKCFYNRFEADAEQHGDASARFPGLRSWLSLNDCFIPRGNTTAAVNKSVTTSDQETLDDLLATVETRSRAEQRARN